MRLEKVGNSERGSGDRGGAWGEQGERGGKGKGKGKGEGKKIRLTSPPALKRKVGIYTQYYVY